MLLGMGRQDKPGDSSKEFSVHFLLSCHRVVVFFSPLSGATIENSPHAAWCIARSPVPINLLCFFQNVFAKSFDFQ